MKKPIQFLVISFALGLLTRSGWADSPNQGRMPIDRDITYEQNLKWENSADKTVTPAKVMRWISSMRGQPVSAPPSPTEFQPIVNAHDGHIRLVAALAYKF